MTCKSQKKVTDSMTAKTERYFYFRYKNRSNFIKREALTMLQTHTPMKT